MRKIADLMRERDDLIDEKVALILKCQAKNTTIGTVYDMLGGELPDGQEHHSRDQVMDYIAERESFD
jgi:hypothetical protein